ncbi:transmembrane protein 26-like [Mya arenaria]|uniref:transmembrane protein 26-like n=1 Tax=Mya arenaria TaxID=6604 RepID=UPI0022E5C947|nr:transmembrane protein 26-like [Mya arenaria]XP_052760798.1 transmembrane protein 26-like [Mya arenaria]XP_052760799.1 transmembrane protein 26-like [Mya arenaria]XP_052760800.1 transmembrane protein 26-like [Mya arenaria]XP_052760894.1 transmembrane protein 26-like [Mya arenaria]XP_052760895.1 transmembrane protein 26-like [Mya arenaria]XP_052760897.1 transmembrane protein 26-like [Mya arenaria]XP_052760898.1 transmembrane protein 26-like [Mya arenaria]
MGYISISRALSVRLLFASHGVISIWRLADVTKERRYWYLSSTLVLLFLETMVIVVKRQGKEWKRFCPSVFIYLLTSVPAIWFLELHEFDKRARRLTRAVRVARMNNDTIGPDTPPDGLEDLSASLGSVLGIRFEVRIPIMLTSDQWIRMLEQMLLLVLILGRWLLPKGKLTHDQLSQLLLVYIGTAADIVEFFEAFNEQEVQYHKVLCLVILGIWSLSLVQFSLVLTASRRRRESLRYHLVRPIKGVNTGVGHTDVFGIIVSILLQDLPFLVLRMMLIFHFNVLSYTNMFFTSKNSVVIALMMYRLIVLFLERKRHEDDTVTHNAIDQIPINTIQEPDVFRRTSKIRETLLKAYELQTSHHMNHTDYNCNRDSKIFMLKEEKHKYGKAYYFEMMES